ncbi:MAG: hypothetical protein LBD21_10125 [Tannerellaceae bacterium]|jgi:hypothetical protein|nr:hypothetical protein [Tannerellaceae bacterium]
MDDNNNDGDFTQPYQAFSGMLNLAGRANGEISIVEMRVPVETQMEYFRRSNKIREDRRPRMVEVDECIDRLYDVTVSTEEKKEIISTFAFSNDTRIYRFLEGFLEQQPEGSPLSDWIRMALMECRISIESELLDEKRIYISTGMGGRDNKLRYYVLMVAEGKKPFLPYQREMIEREAPFLLSGVDCEVERITVHDIYCEMVMLAPFSTNLRALLMNLLEECNRYGNFISHRITITNIRELKDAEIRRMIARMGTPQEAPMTGEYVEEDDEEEDGDEE